MATPSLQALPPELLLAVTEYLDVPSLSSLHQCNRQFHSLFFSQLWKYTRTDREVPDAGTVLIWAAQNGNIPVMTRLLDGPEWPADNENDTTALNEAIIYQNEECVRILLDAGADLTTDASPDQPPLITAAEYLNTTIFRLVLEKSLQTLPRNELQQQWSGTFTAAVESESGPILRLLLDHADVFCDGDAKEEITQMLQTRAARKGDCGVIKVLFDNGADPRGDPGMLLDILVEGDHADAIRLFANCGLAQEYEQQPMNPLHVAAMNGYTRSVSALLDAGFDLEHRGRCKRTPLLDAVQNGHIETTEYLLDAGANIHAKEWDGQNVIDLAVRNDDPHDTTSSHKEGSFGDSNGTTESQILSFKTARKAGAPGSFSIAVLNDMGYTNAQGTHRELLKAANNGTAFAWHGGDLSYADDWFSGILPCADDWPVCYNGTSTELPGGGPIPEEYKQPLPEGESANQGGPQGGDMSVLYESNWDLWQQWMGNFTMKIPHMVMPGNHEAACAEFDGPGNPITAYLNEDISNGSWPEANLTYYSCPPSQRNFTAFQHRFRMPGPETGGVGNFFYSFSYGLAHFISLDGETDFANSPFTPLQVDATGDEKFPTPEETETTDSGPFGPVEGGRFNDTKAYAQYRFLKKDLESIDRSKTPWVFVMSHRPMYSSAYSSYQTNLRAAFEDLLLEHGVDAYLSGHIHWYERMYPMTGNGTIDHSAIVNNHTYLSNTGRSMTHIVNGMAGNIESHSEFDEGEGLTPITAHLDRTHYGFSKLTVVDEKTVKWEFVRGDNGKTGDYLTLVKDSARSGRCDVEW
ncbi:Metallo-dependent phosphatase-like protein [Aspergillus venezuelensis]